MLIGGISHYSKVVIIFKKFCVIKDITNWWIFFYDAKSGKYHSPENNPFCQLYHIATLGVVYYHPPGLTEKYMANISEYTPTPGNI